MHTHTQTHTHTYRHVKIYSDTITVENMKGIYIALWKTEKKQNSDFLKEKQTKNEIPKKNNKMQRVNG